MGNRLAINAPSQIVPVDYYLKDLEEDILVKASLGNTCFLKVVRCTSGEGSVVVKVFVNRDGSVKLEPYEDCLHRVHSLLDNAAPNCLMYASCKVTDIAGIMVRQHVDSSLYERISSRPFLTQLEKAWLAFQLLCALRQAHQAEVHHGDIKTENVLVTRCGWLQLTDFAPFKPVNLPDNDPSDFTYFFDTSRRRTCYIAPERFISHESKEGTPDPNASEAATTDSTLPSSTSSHLTPAMDIFSAGCVLIELFTEGSVPFNLTQLLSYRKGNYSVQRPFEKIQDKNVIALLKSMISLDPRDRKSAGEYLELQKGVTFPPYFYSFLWPYCKQFAEQPKKIPDNTIKLISDNLPDILLNLGSESIASIDNTLSLSHCTSSNGIHNLMSDQKMSVWPPFTHEALAALNEAEMRMLESKSEALILILPLLTSAFRTCKLCSSKLLALDTLVRLSRFCPDSILLDRVLPTMLTGLENHIEASVRARAISSVTHCLALVTSLQRQDATIFPEYILPSLARALSDPKSIVRQSLAENISTLADTAMRFLDWSKDNNYFTGIEYDSEKQNLHASIQSLVTQLIMDQSNNVKRSFMHSLDDKLFNFFGKEKPENEILTHLITYLNDAKDFNLRKEFFECLKKNAAMIGSCQDEILVPLIMQGMCDSEEWVVMASINLLTALAEKRIIENGKLYSTFKNVVHFVMHPNLLVRQSTVHLLSVVADQFTGVDAMAVLTPIMRPFVMSDKGDICDLTCEFSIQVPLRPSINRSLWNTVLNITDLSGFINRLEGALNQERFTVPHFLESTMPTNYPSDDRYVMRIIQQGMDRPLARDFVSFRTHLLGIRDHKKAAEIQSNSKEEDQKEGASIFIENEKLEFVTLNEESVDGLWATCEDKVDRRLIPIEDPSKEVNLPSTPSDNVLISDSERQNRKVINNRLRQYRDKNNRMKRISSSSFVGDSTSGWEPSGILISHLHEHTQRVNGLCNIEGTALFASASSDGTVKIWDANKTEREHPINRSRATYARMNAPVWSITPCASQNALAISSHEGSIHVFKLDKMSLVCDRQLDPLEDDHAVDLSFYDTGCGENVVVYATITGAVVGWDLRQPGTAWRFNNTVKRGLITSLLVDRETNFLCLATSKGIISSWDLRYQINLGEDIVHEKEHFIRRLAKNPCDHRSIFASVAGHNEVNMYEIETKYRKRTLWASSVEPFKYSERCGGSTKTVNAMVVGRRGPSKEDIYVITGSTDCTLRYWNLAKPSASKVISHNAIDHGNEPEMCYKEFPKLGVITEDKDLKKKRDGESFLDPLKASTGHKDLITGLTIVDMPQKLLVSSDATGVIKMWK